MDVSLPLFLPPPLSKSEYMKYNKTKRIPKADVSLLMEGAPADTNADAAGGICSLLTVQLKEV